MIGVGTKIRFADGTMKNVETVVVGSSLMGLKKTHQTVTAVTRSSSPLLAVTFAPRKIGKQDITVLLSPDQVILIHREQIVLSEFKQFISRKGKRAAHMLIHSEDKKQPLQIKSIVPHADGDAVHIVTGGAVFIKGGLHVLAK